MNNSNKYIKLDKPLAIGGSVMNDITCSESLRKYFNYYTFWAEYRMDIEDVPESLLVIPALSSILTLSWAKCADIFLDEIDQKFLI